MQYFVYQPSNFQGVRYGCVIQFVGILNIRHLSANGFTPPCIFQCTVSDIDCLPPTNKQLSESQLNFPVSKWFLLFWELIKTAMNSHNNMIQEDNLANITTSLWKYFFLLCTEVKFWLLITSQWQWCSRWHSMVMASSLW